MATSGEPPPGTASRGNAAAVWSLVLGVGGMLVFMIAASALLFFVNLPLSIPAWILGARGRRQVDRGETSDGRGAARAGRMLGIVGTILGVLGLLAWIVLIVWLGVLALDPDSGLYD